MKYITWKTSQTRTACLLIAFVCFSCSTAAFGQCSTDAWTSVTGTGTPLALGTSTIPTGMKYEQSCGLTVDAALAPGYVTTSTPIDESAISARFYLLHDALDITSGDVTLLTARNGPTVEFEIRLRSTGSVKHLVSFYRNGGPLTEHPEIFALQDIWQAVEVAWSAGDGNGRFDLKIDDILQFSVTNLNNDGALVNEVDFGVTNAASATGELALDAIELRRAGESGLLIINELENISTRADVRTVHEIVIGGFIIEGDTDKCVVVRGRGPSVGVPDGVVRLSDPTLVLKLGSTTLDSNNNWRDSPEADVIENLGLQPTDDADAAIYACLPPEKYTALLRGAGGVTGVGIVEVYDADNGTPFLYNISTRAPVDVSNLVAIGGFIIEGDQPKQVLIRGRGLSVGVPDGVIRLPDPVLRIVDSDNTTVASNNDWGDADNVSAIEATGLAPEDPADAAVLITLDPGRYTAILRGAGGVTGVGIVEVYDLSGGSIAPQ